MPPIVEFFPEFAFTLRHCSLLYIEEDLLSEVGKGHKSDGDPQDPATNAQVTVVFVLNNIYMVLSTRLWLQSRHLTESANPQVAYRLNAPGLMSNVGWFAGFIGCFKPMWMMMGKGKQQEIEKGTI